MPEVYLCMKKLISSYLTICLLVLFSFKAHAINEDKLKSIPEVEMTEPVKDFLVIEKKLRVSFFRASAFYYLPEKHQSFNEYLKLIEESKKNKSNLTFKVKPIKNEIIKISK